MSTTGLCLDVDGTLYRDGSVFVESIAYLPFVRPGPWVRADRRAVRRAVGHVGRYHGGRWTDWRWRATLGAVEVLRRVGGADVALATLDHARTVRERLDDLVSSGSGPSSSTDPYDEMRTAVLTAYGRAVASHERATIRAALSAVVERLGPVDATTAGALRDVAGSLDVVLVTDMPAVVADAFTEHALDASVRTTVATRFETDSAGRFTGAYEPVDKAATVEALRDRYGWDRIVAVGDTARDLGMRAQADQFVAVAGQGRIGDHLAASSVDAGGATARTIRAAETVYVPAETPLGEVLRVIAPA